MAKKLSVTVSFSVLQNLVEEIGKDKVSVNVIVPRNCDPHTYQPKITDARNLAKSDIVFVNGLGFEGWLDRLITASGFTGTVVIVSDKIKARSLLSGEGLDPHAWHNVTNAIAYAKVIIDALCALDAGNAGFYKLQGRIYRRKLHDLHARIKALFKPIPLTRRKVVTTHDAFWYFGDAYKITFYAPLGINTDMQPSATDIARLIEQMRSQQISAVFFENLANRQLLSQITEEVNVRVGGVIYADSLSEKGGCAATYIDMMWHNASLIADSLTGKSK